MSVLALARIAIQADEEFREAVGIVTRQFMLSNRSDQDWMVVDKYLHFFDKNGDSGGPEWEVEERWEQDNAVVLQCYDGDQDTYLIVLDADKEQK